MNQSKQHISKLTKMAAMLPELIAKLEAAEAELTARMAAVKAQGLIYANEHWKDGKYMTLLYPSKSGEPRRREYVGNDPVKVREAQARIQRAKDYEALAKQAQQLNEVVLTGLSKLDEATRVLAGKR